MQEKIGFGVSGPLAAPWFDGRKAAKLISVAYEAGYRHFDTALFYGGGRGVTRLGAGLHAAITKDRNGLTLSSKIGTKKIGGSDMRPVLGKDFSRDHTLREVEQNLNALHTDYLDILYMHGPSDVELVQTLPILQDLKRQNIIRKIGLCSDLLGQAVQQPELDVIMAHYNILHRQHTDELQQFKKINPNGKVVGISPLIQGLFRKDFATPKKLSDIWYIARAALKNKPQWQKAKDLDILHQQPNWTAAELCLQFALSHPAVDSVMTTSTRAENINENMKAVQRELPADIYEKLISIKTKE